MSKSVSFRLSSKFMLFVPLLEYILILGALLAAGLTLYINQVQPLMYIGLVFLVGVLGWGVCAYGYFKWRDRFLEIGNEGIVLFGLPIAWKYIESDVVSGVLRLHITDASVVDLGRIPWMFSRSRSAFTMVHFTRQEIRFFWWMFDGSFQEVLSAFESKKPTGTPEYIAEKAEIKRQGRIFSFKESVISGIALSLILVAYAAYIITQDGLAAAVPMVPIMVIILAAFWYAILSSR